jgi:hypothetical protein
VTTHDPEDDALRGALAELRVEDRAGAPSFERVLARRTHRTGPTRRASIVVGLAAAALLLLVTDTARRAIDRPRLTVPPEIVALAAWRPVTDVLLTMPGSALLRSSPSLGPSLLGAMPMLDTPAGGNER